MVPHSLKTKLDGYVGNDETALADVEDKEQANQESVPQTVRKPLEVRPRPDLGAGRNCQVRANAETCRKELTGSQGDPAKCCPGRKVQRGVSEGRLSESKGRKEQTAHVASTIGPK